MTIDKIPMKRMNRFESKFYLYSSVMGADYSTLLWKIFKQKYDQMKSVLEKFPNHIYTHKIIEVKLCHWDMFNLYTYNPYDGSEELEEGVVKLVINGVATYY